MLFSPLATLHGQIDEILRTKLSKQLFSPKRDDLLRLTKWRVWSIRYSVSLSYIVEKLVPYYEKLSSRHYVRRRAGSSKGLGASIATLTGDVAEEKLREFIAKDFPDAENVSAMREVSKSRCLYKMDREENTGRPRPILHYPTLTDFVSTYRKKIERSRRSSSRMDKKMARMSWRNNPWR